jgi:hypothetical protein
MLDVIPELTAREDISALERSDIWRIAINGWPGLYVDIALISDPVIHIDVAGTVDAEDELTNPLLPDLVRGAVEGRLRAYC